MGKIIKMILLVSLFFLIGCKANMDLEEDDKISIVVSIIPQKAFVEKVGGDLVDISVMVPKGASPASYEPMPGDLKAIEKAKIYFKIGHITFEEVNMERFKKLNQNMSVIDLSQGLQLRHFEKTEQEEMTENENDDQTLNEHHHENIDPHTWLSITNAQLMVDKISQTLSSYDPKNEQTYKKNAENYIAELDGLKKYAKEELKKTNISKILVFHPAWGYFCDDFDIEQIAIEKDGNMPTSKYLSTIIQLAQEENIDIILVQSQNDRSVADSVAEEIGAEATSADPLSEDYIDNLKSIIEIFQRK